MKTGHFLTVLATILLIFAIYSQFKKKEQYGIVVNVVDGDTIHFMPETYEYYLTIRVFGVDCPEFNQKGGLLAHSFTQRFALGKKAKIKRVDVDKYGRIVANVIIDGKDLSEELLKVGLAWHLEHTTERNILWHSLFEQAKKEKIGIWGLEGKNEEPYVFRNRKRKDHKQKRTVHSSFEGIIVESYVPEVITIQKQDGSGLIVFVQEQVT